MINSNNKSFTILEVIVAIFILTVAAFGSFSLIQQTIIGTSLNQSKLIAYYLSQEGIENIRNIRDSNWLAEVAWDKGIDSGEETIDKFQRKITISRPEADILEVSVEVFWSERGRTHEVKAETELYNWK